MCVKKHRNQKRGLAWRGREGERERERKRERAGARADEDVGPYTEKAMASVAAPNIRTDTRASRQHGT